MSQDSPAALLFDQNGNPVSVIFDGTYYRIQVEAKLTSNTSLISNRTTTANRTTVLSTDSDILLLSSNSSRVDSYIYNHSDSALLIGLGTTTVTSSNYTTLITAQIGYAIPFNFTGEIRGMWLTATGAAYMTELTQ